jgi:hypothetical protein
MYKAGAFSFVVSRWIKNGFKETPEKILEWIVHYENESVFG